MTQLLMLAQLLPASLAIGGVLLFVVGLAVWIGKNASAIRDTVRLARDLGRWVAKSVDAEFRGIQRMAKTIGSRHPRSTALFLASGSGFLYSMTVLVTVAGAALLLVALSAQGQPVWYLPLAVAGFTFALAVNILHLVTAAYDAHQLARHWYAR